MSAGGGESPEGRGQEGRESRVLSWVLGPPTSERLSPFTLLSTIPRAFGDELPGCRVENGQAAREAVLQGSRGDCGDLYQGTVLEME